MTQYEKAIKYLMLVQKRSEEEASELCDMFQFAVSYWAEQYDWYR